KNSQSQGSEPYEPSTSKRKRGKKTKAQKESFYHLMKRKKSGVVSLDHKRKKIDNLEEDEDVMKREFGALCNQGKILVFLKKLLVEWNQEFDKTSEVEKRTAIWKATFATFKQCERYLNPLFKFCRKKHLPDDIQQALMLMVNCCMERDYKAAEYHYIRMAIGNAPWPIGETMVGIHERSAREKIYTNSVGHVMNDETTRKYLRSVKRLMTFCETRYPTMSSKTGEFNSLVNGSELQALLGEKKRIASGSQFILGC
nr:pre-mRNA-splicing factor 18 [Tanacetum cinerariifolium]